MHLVNFLLDEHPAALVRVPRARGRRAQLLLQQRVRRVQIDAVVNLNARRRLEVLQLDPGDGAVIILYACTHAAAFEDDAAATAR